ncbi:5'-nucleotidase-like [Apostichopus japonicus]|uniref:5'-nucleotidase-like n=1 Tax=Stichopus japonicus TaxID=307972 RepID=UPI003AB478AB
MAADAFLWEHVTVQNDGWSDVSIALISSGGLRSSIPAGEIKLNDITTVMPFSDTVDLVELRGHHLLEVLERSVEEYDLIILPGFFLQYSGLRVTYDVSRPAGNRVASVDVLCSYCPIPFYEPLDLENVYKIVVQSYLIEGGDGYTMIAENMISHKTGRKDSEIMSSYLEQHSPVAPRLEGRIIIIGETSTAPSLRVQRIIIMLLFVIQWFIN